MGKNLKESILSSPKLSEQLKEKLKTLENDAVESFLPVYILNRLNGRYLLPLKEELPSMTKDGLIVVNVCFDSGLKPKKESITLMCQYFIEEKKFPYINKVVTNILYSKNPKKELHKVFKTLI